MKELLEKLRELMAKSPQSCYFNDPADESQIKALEEKFNINLPESYKEFLMAYNGGFIAFLDDALEMDINDLAWNSNYILAVEIIDELFEGINYKTEGMDVRYIPLMHTANGEYLGFQYPLEGKESKVYDLWHEAPAQDWAESVVFESFTDLLKEYITGKGDIETIG